MVVKLSILRGMSREHRRNDGGVPKTISPSTKPKKPQPQKHVVSSKPGALPEDIRADKLNAKQVYENMIKQQRALLKETKNKKERKRINKIIRDSRDRIDEIDSELGIEQLAKIKVTKPDNPSDSEGQVPIHEVKLFKKEGVGNAEVQEAEQLARSLIIEPKDINSNGSDSIIGHSRAKNLAKVNIRFPQIAPQLYDDIRKPTRAFLFMGPPGTGKTELAKGFAKDSNMSFMELRASDILSKFVGTAEKSIRAVFREAEKRQPILIFIDEADDLLGIRGGDEKVQKITNEIFKALSDIDTSNEQIYVIAATNRPKNLDTAAVRRFTPVRIDLPQLEERRAILESKTRSPNIKMAPIDYDLLARETEGYSGSDLAKVAELTLTRPIQELVEGLSDKELQLVKGVSSKSLRAITTNDFLETLKNQPPSTSEEDLEAMDEFWERVKDNS